MTALRRAAVFDLDGTLIDSMPLVLQAYAEAVKPFHPEMTEDEIRGYLGGPPERIFAGMPLTAQQAAEALRRLRTAGGERWRRIDAFPGAAALLRELRGAGVAVGVWTGRERESTEWLARRHGFWDLLETCVCGDDLPSHKPDPAGLAEVLRRLGVDTAGAMFVGDADVDVLAGAALGVRTLLITHGLTVGAEAMSRAWQVVKAPAEAYARVRMELMAGR